MPHMDPFYEGLTISGKYHHTLTTNNMNNMNNNNMNNNNMNNDNNAKNKNKNKNKKIQIKNRFFTDKNNNNDNNRSSTNNSIEMILARKRTKRLLTFGKRDFTFVSVSDVPQSDGVWVSGTVSVITSKLPKKSSYTRAFQDSIAFYKPLPPVVVTTNTNTNTNTNNNDDDDANSHVGSNVIKHRTGLTIVCRIDLNDSTDGGEGGGIPMWIYVKTIGTTGALSMQNMKKQLLNGFQQNK